MAVMIKPDLEEALAARARSEGLSIEQFVNRELERAVARGPAAPEVTPEERLEGWHKFVTQYAVGGPPLSDYAVSRESIYTREDEML